MGVLWVASVPPYSAGRWMTPDEVLLCQGFPVSRMAPDIFRHACYFSVDRAARKRESVKGQAGNATCVPCIGALLLFITCTVRMSGDKPSGCDPEQLATASKFSAMLGRRSKKRKAQ